MPGEGERVVACGSGDDAARRFLWREREQRVARTALLERAGELLVLILEEEVGARRLAQPVRASARRLENTRTDAVHGAHAVLKFDAVGCRRELIIHGSGKSLASLHPAICAKSAKLLLFSRGLHTP